MSESHETLFRDEEFTGNTRLFLVPDLVLFPNVVQALRVEDARQRQLLVDALSTDSLITVATSVAQPAGQSSISSEVCLARVISHRQHEDGSLEILVLGLRRAVIRQSVLSPKQYHEAEIELLSEVGASAPKAEKLCLQLATAARNALSGWPCGELLQKTMIEQLDLSLMTDLLAYWMPLTVTQKLRLLRETRVRRRVTALMAYLRRMTTARPSYSSTKNCFPPVFSVN